MSSLSLRALAKRFGQQQVLHGIDLDVAEGEFMVLVGPSGSGKTTLLRMIAGLERITEGELLVGGRRMNGVPPRDRDMAMVFQNYALYPHMSVRENLGFSLRMRGAPRSRIEARVRETAHLPGLKQLLERHPAELSGGQQQRVAIGRAIVRDPQVFLFDEPLSNLDGSLRTQMRTELAALHRRLGTTSLYVTHDQTEAMAMADRIAVLRAGRIEQLGTPLELYDRPANLFVAGFIGSPAMNLVNGVARRLNGSLSLQAADGTWLPLAAGAPAREGQAIVYGFRPEACSVEAAHGGVPATVAQVETIGPTVQIYARLAGTTVCAVSSERRGWRAGDKIRLAPHLAKVLLFEPGSGKAL